MRLKQTAKGRALPHSAKEEVLTLELKRRLLNHCLKRKHSILSSLRRSDRNEIPQF